MLQTEPKVYDYEPQSLKTALKHRSSKL